ncbi:hypothetical protein [Phenylobacterium sp.]|uniref:hypothetical protein n=1 Tax=Phenylobacterium sp. TaxID=1871053 RepID=UPI003BAD54DA
MEHGNQILDLAAAGWGDDPIFGWVSAEGADLGGALADHQISRSVQHQDALSIDGLD